VLEEEAEKVRERGKEAAEFPGTAYFAVDMTAALLPGHEKAIEKISELMKDRKLDFKQLRVGDMLPNDQASIVAMTRSLIDWNNRNVYCPACGRKTISVWAGAKRACMHHDAANPTDGRPACISGKGIHNFCYPRTDPVVIMAIISGDGERVLLGRQKRFPPRMYSTLAGFLEPGESLEECVRREVWEESGVKVGRVTYHSSQPWPFPASSLMMGCIGEALTEDISLKNDPELEHAQWYPKEEVREAFKYGAGGMFDKPREGYEGLRVPPSSAIAHMLIKAFVTSEWGLGASSVRL